MTIGGFSMTIEIQQPQLRPSILNRELSSLLLSSIVNESIVIRH